MDRLRKIADLAQLAAILETSSFKPGNVDPLHDFGGTSYGDFLSGSIAIGSAIGDSAILGFKAGKGEISLSEIGIGGNIKKAVSDVRKSHRGGNTHLGIAMLFVPISSAVGICIAKNSNFNKSLIRGLRPRSFESKAFELRKNMKEIIKNSTIDDSINFYNAIKIANAGGLKGKLIERNIPFHELMKISAKKDRIAEELSNGMRVVFYTGLPYLKKFYEESKDVREAITRTYLQTLAEFPDTLIAKKAGLEIAKKISKNAKLVLKGKKNIEDLDRELRSGDNELNPGTTADIVAASVFVWFLVNNGKHTL